MIWLNWRMNVVSAFCCVGAKFDIGFSRQHQMNFNLETL